MTNRDETKRIINKTIKYMNKTIHDIQENLDKILNKAVLKSNTHDILLHRANIIVVNDNRKYLKNKEFEKTLVWCLSLYDLTHNVSKSIKWVRPSYSRKPDVRISTFFRLFSEHFYNEENNSNYFGKEGKNALCRFKFFSNKALMYYKKGKKRKCMRNLSYACHFLADMNEPHHVTNNIDKPNNFLGEIIDFANIEGIGEGIFSNHSVFEKIVRKWLKDQNKSSKMISKYAKGESFLLDSVLDSNEIYNYIIGKKNLEKEENKDKVSMINQIYNKNLDLPLEEYCDYIAIESARYAREFIEDTRVNNSKEQIIAAVRTLNMAQVQLSRFIYYFCTLANENKMD
ncbi:MAG: phospholipase C [Sarcina sp.]